LKCGVDRKYVASGVGMNNKLQSLKVTDMSSRHLARLFYKEHRRLVHFVRNNNNATMFIST